MINMPYIEESDPGECVCWLPNNGFACSCSKAQRSLFRFASSKDLCMTEDQREECLTEIEKVEGHTRQRHVDDSSWNLAFAVLAACFKES